MQACPVTRATVGEAKGEAALLAQNPRGPGQSALILCMKPGCSNNIHKTTKEKNSTHQQETFYLNNQQKCWEGKPRG